MPKNDEQFWCGVPAPESIGVYITTKGSVGSRPKTLKAAVQDEFFVGRASSVCSIFFPHPYISSVHGKISYDGTNWWFTNLGTNKTYYERKGVQKILQRGAEICLATGDVVYFLFQEPMYCLEFHPGMAFDETVINDEPTAKGSTDLSYIDTPIELAVYLTTVAQELPLIRLLVISAVLLIAWWIWNR